MTVVVFVIARQQRHVIRVTTVDFGAGLGFGGAAVQAHGCEGGTPRSGREHRYEGPGVARDAGCGDSSVT